MRQRLLKAACVAESILDGFFAAMIIPPLIIGTVVAGFISACGASSIDAVHEAAELIGGCAHWFVVVAIWAWVDIGFMSRDDDRAWRVAAISGAFGAIAGFDAMEAISGVSGWDLLVGVGAGVLLGALGAISGLMYARWSGRKLIRLAPPPGSAAAQ